MVVVYYACQMACVYMSYYWRLLRILYGCPIYHVCSMMNVYYVCHHICV